MVSSYASGYLIPSDFRRSTFSTAEKKAYINAVQCLAKLPPKTTKEVCPGCRNRYDDFVATHIQQSFNIHVTGNFLTWVRNTADVHRLSGSL
jgi:hypothetical protein